MRTVIGKYVRRSIVSLMILQSLILLQIIVLLLLRMVTKYVSADIQSKRKQNLAIAILMMIIPAMTNQMATIKTLPQDTLECILSGVLH